MTKESYEEYKKLFSKNQKNKVFLESVKNNFIVIQKDYDFKRI